MKQLFAIFLLFLCGNLRAQEVMHFSARQVLFDTLWLHQTPVPVTSDMYGKKFQLVLINLHANETTSIDAATEYLGNKQGMLITLDQDTTRFLKFTFQNKLIQFDPNRIFSQKGRLANLQLLNRKTPAAAEKIVAGFANNLLKRLGHPKVIIAMHNNTDGNLSVKSYKDRYINPAMDADDFILTTEKKIFDQLKKKNINAVLQTQQTSTDDGSLAIYCSKKKIPYINIEAQEGHKREQLQMLNDLTDIIQQYTR